MRLWFKKVSVLLITFMTLGVFIPPTYLDTHAESKQFVSSSGDVNDNATTTTDLGQDHSSDDPLEEESDSEVDIGAYLRGVLTEQAVEQTIYKLGPRIARQVEDEVMSTIVPNIEEVIEMILQEAGEEEFQYFGVSEQPAEGYGEKIFSLYDHRTKEDIARFDVRRENRPRNGYWFNFHYHLSSDDFEQHYQIGDVYWDKNTPPKWMST